MNIWFYAPFKPLDHPDPSGDRTIGSGVRDFLERKGHRLRTVSTFRTRWIYNKPWIWHIWLREHRRIHRRILQSPPDVWLTYHSYYKAPDILGPSLAHQANIPYVIFQGIYATKVKRRLMTRAGYYLNTRALKTAGRIFTNKRIDHKNLLRITPPKQLHYISPGIVPGDFQRDAAAGEALRRQWQVGDDPVVLAAAMFRSDVKSEGLAWLIRSCGELFRRGNTFFLVIAGEGKEKHRLTALAREYLPGRTLFVGKIPRDEMFRFFSAGDLFAFPGIGESLGMVYLEAQSCGLPVVAFENGGVSEVVQNGKTGLLVPMYDRNAYVRSMEKILQHPDLKQKMGRAASDYVSRVHDLNVNYLEIDRILKRIVHDRTPKNRIRSAAARQDRVE